MDSDHHHQVVLPGLTRPGLNKMNIRYDAPREVPPGMPSLPMLCLIQGSSSTGKTTALLEMVTIYNRSKSIDFMTLFSPTYQMDPKQRALGDTPGKSYSFEAIEQYSDLALKACIGEIKARVEKHKAWLKYNAAYQKFIQCRSEEDIIKRLTAQELMLLEMNDFEPMQPVCEHGKFPQSMLIFDDLAADQRLFTANGKGELGSFLILARHWGCSIVILSQTRTALNKQLRANLNVLILFRCRAKSIQQAVAEEFASYVDEETFCRMWDQATTEPNDFFMCDLRNRQCMFRKNFDCIMGGAA